MRFTKITLRTLHRSFGGRRLLYWSSLLGFLVFFKGSSVLGSVCEGPISVSVGGFAERPASFPGFHFITTRRVEISLFDLFNAPEEPDPEPTGPHSTSDMAAVRGDSPFLWLSTADRCLTKSILARCAASFQQRVRPPLFVLYHAWKHFPA